MRPTTEELSRLADLAERGRVRGVLDELDRIEARDTELRPWVERMRTLVRSFRLKDIQESLRVR